MNQSLEKYKVGIIGLGGTGSYILDLVAKTPVQGITLFDGDFMLQHNAFRSPGAMTTLELDKQPNKAEHFKGIYSAMHRNILSIPQFINQENITMLDQLSFVFICVDSNKVRKLISNHLIEHSIPFIDVGLGVELVENQLVGLLRVTAATAEKNNHLQSRVSAEEDDDDIYASNIQIADLNALNAALAIIKWKKLAGFYQDMEQEHHSIYSINTSKIFNEDFKTPIR